MSKISFSRPKSIINAQNQHKKMAVFTIDDLGRPQQKLSEINYTVSSIFPAPVDILEPAIEYLNKNYNKDIKLDTVSAMCNLSPSYFSRVFSASYNMTFSSYLVNLRMYQAKKLLKTTNQTIISIAYSVGYFDNGYFSRLFKKYNGCTPLQYRKNEIDVYLNE